MAYRDPASALSEPGAPLLQEPSPKSYATAVSLSAVFGFVGVQHFYLGRIGEGLVDVALSIGWIVCFAAGDALLGTLLLLLDFGHSFVVTIMLLTGSFKDGSGRTVRYPGQKLNTPKRAMSHG
jgi:TM2 domain-containing membrane protein YozV